MIQKIAIPFYFLSFTFIVAAQPTDTPQILFSKQSHFGLIEVVRQPNGDLNICEDKDYTQTHSIIRQGDPTYMGTKYASFATAAFCFLKKPTDILLLGLGAGEFLSYFVNYFPNASVDVVEINPVMVEIVKGFRSLKINEEKVHFICADAFKYVSDMHKMYELIYCDIYFFTPPVASLYQNFFNHVKKHLTPQGVFVINVIQMPQSVVKDMLSQFDNIAMLNTQLGNIVFICYQGLIKTTAELQLIAAQLQNQYQFRYSLPDISKEIEHVTSTNKNSVLNQFPK